MTVAQLKVVPKRIKVSKKNADLRIWIGTMDPEEGFIKIGPEHHKPAQVVDLDERWPIDDNAVTTVYAAYYFHRITLEQRFAFMNEAHRVLKPGGQLIMVMPHWTSARSIGDPEAKWPPIGEVTFWWFSKKWRETERMTHLPLTCDFGDVFGCGTTLDQDVALRNEDYQANARKHWVNANNDLHVTLTKP